MANIILFDLETSNLEADFGRILSMSWKRLGEKKIYNTRIGKDVTSDKAICEYATKVLSDADLWITWYGRRFDVPFLQTRCIANGMNVLPPTPHIDGWEIARYKMKLHANRLASVSQFLGLPEKTPILPDVWVRARSGDRKALDYIVEHCDRDVEVLELAYLAIVPLCTTHPNVHLVMGQTSQTCPVCGSKKLQRRGWRVARVNRVQRYQCQKCGAWSSGKSERYRGVEVR